MAIVVAAVRAIVAVTIVVAIIGARVAVAVVRARVAMAIVVAVIGACVAVAIVMMAIVLRVFVVVPTVVSFMLVVVRFAVRLALAMEQVQLTAYLAVLKIARTAIGGRYAIIGMHIDVGLTGLECRDQLRQGPAG